MLLLQVQEVCSQFVRFVHVLVPRIDSDKKKFEASNYTFNVDYGLSGLFLFLFLWCFSWSCLNYFSSRRVGLVLLVDLLAGFLFLVAVGIIIILHTYTLFIPFLAYGDTPVMLATQSDSPSPVLPYMGSINHQICVVLFVLSHHE